MAPAPDTPDFELARRIHTVLTMHFIEGRTQSEISVRLNMSTAKVNRLIKQGRDLGMLNFSINNPYGRLYDIEREFEMIMGVENTLVTPSVTGNPDTNLGQVGKAAGNLLARNVRKGDTIAISGGKAVRAMIENLEPGRALDVNVVPLTGGVQGQHFTDVNHLATLLAERLGGRATLIHAPLFAETPQERNMLMSVRSVRDVFEIARNASIALVGIGSVADSQSTYYEAVPMADHARQALTESGVRGEFLGHLVDADGGLSDVEFNSRLVALPPSEAAGIPMKVGIVSGAEKVAPAGAVLRGGYLNALVLDEDTARGILESAGKARDR